MKLSYKLITLSGIPVYIHWTFGFILFLALNVGYSLDLDWQGTSKVLLFFLVIFMCVVLHEMGHALAARKYGIKTRDIILTPIGGIARLEGLPEQPLREIVVAIAGPLVNIAIALLIWAGLNIFTEQGTSFVGDEYNYFTEASNFLPLVFSTNLGLAIFNLIPAFPLDGGRIFRALLAFKFSRERATFFAARSGQLIAILFGLYGLYAQEYSLILIGVFIYYSANAEYVGIRNNAMLGAHTVEEITWTNFRTLHPDEPMSTALAYLIKGHETNFIVMDHWDNIVGIVIQQDIIQAKNSNNLHKPVEKYVRYMNKSFHEGDSLMTAYQTMQSNGIPIVPVYNENGLVGVLDADAIDHFLDLKSNFK